jgi:hypothetical protein
MKIIFFIFRNDVKSIIAKMHFTMSPLKCIRQLEEARREAALFSPSNYITLFLILLTCEIASVSKRIRIRTTIKIISLVAPFIDKVSYISA